MSRYESRVVEVMVELNADVGAPADEIFSVAHDLEGLGFRLDESFSPVPMGEGAPYRDLPPGRETVIVRGVVSADSVEGLSSHPVVWKVWRDAKIEFRIKHRARLHRRGSGLFCPIEPCDCNMKADGKLKDVRAVLGVKKIWEQERLKGSGVTVGIVDDGISAVKRVPDGKIKNVCGGWPADWGTIAFNEHGNMVAYDVLGMAPEVRLLDLRICATDFKGRLSNAIAAFKWCIDEFEKNGSPQILVNSWALLREEVAPCYARDPANPFTVKVGQAVDLGMIVLFAAGNCGPKCPIGCLAQEERLIWGANGSPRVVTVGAVNRKRKLIGYSNSGPGAIDPQKPDVCGISEFNGYFDYPGGVDFGTSAACPIVGGVVALLKQKDPSLTPEKMKKILTTTAQQIGGLVGWNRYSGFGVIDAWEAFQSL